MTLRNMQSSNFSSHSKNLRNYHSADLPYGSYKKSLRVWCYYVLVKLWWTREAEHIHMTEMGNACIFVGKPKRKNRSVTWSFKSSLPYIFPARSLSTEAVWTTIPHTICTSWVFLEMKQADRQRPRAKCQVFKHFLGKVYYVNGRKQNRNVTAVENLWTSALHSKFYAVNNLRHCNRIF